jgi:hypothetical protein
MIDFLYSLGQVLCCLGLGYGAFLALRHSRTYFRIGEVRFERRRTRRQSKREAVEPDAHGTNLGYWP